MTTYQFGFLLCRSGREFSQVFRMKAERFDIQNYKSSQALGKT